MKKTLLLLSTVVVLQGFAQGAWTLKNDFVGQRTRMTAFSIAGKGYAGTGMDASNNFYKDFWEYDPVTDTWSQKADVGNQVREQAVGFSIGNKGYIGMGRVGSGLYLDDFWEYNPSTNSWVQKANYPNGGRAYPAGFSIDTLGYVGTGYNSSSWYVDFCCFSPTTNTWTPKANFGGAGRGGAVGFSINGYGYIGTGRDAVGPYADFWRYDPVANSWLPRASVPGSNRTVASGFVLNGRGYIGVGVNGTTYYTDFYEYNTVANTWSPIASFAGSARAAAFSFSIGNSAYVATGDNTVPSTSYFDDVWMFTNCAVSTTISSVNVDCYGNCNGTAMAIPAGNSGPVSYLWMPGAQTTATISNLCAGTYTVTVTDSLGCFATQTVVITQPSPVSVNVSFPIDTLCLADGATTLTGASPGGGFWGGPGVSGNQIVPAVAGVGQHTIFYNYTDGNGCSGFDTDTMWIDACLRLTETGSASLVAIYPNPSTGLIFIDTEEPGDVIFYNVNGQIAMQRKIIAGRNAINAESLTNGVYSVECRLNSGLITNNKVMINK